MHFLESVSLDTEGSEYNILKAHYFDKYLLSIIELKRIELLLGNYWKLNDTCLLYNGVLLMMNIYLEI